MNNFREQISPYIHSDHSYMTLAAFEQLPESMKDQIKTEAGLLIRWFCEMPDCYWELFGTLGEWEINNHFSFDWRRNLKASFFLGSNPVTGRGVRYEHVISGALRAVPELLQNAVNALSKGKLRHGLAFTGAVFHYIQDPMTFPEQQSVHRREMSDFARIAIPDYQPKVLFKDPSEMPEAVEKIFKGEADTIMSEAVLGIRKCMRDGDDQGRKKIQLKCDNLGARLSADLLFSVLKFYQPGEPGLLNRVQDFTEIDEERLPDGYFIDRDDSTVFQGYAAVEGQLRRGYDTRKTPGLQLRLSATGDTEVRWKQSIIDALPIVSKQEYEFFCSAYCDHLTGDNGYRLIFYDECWELCETLEFPFQIGDGWDENAHKFTSPDRAIAVTVDFYSTANSGTVLVDHWILRDTRVTIENKPKTIDNRIRLILVPGDDYRLRDLSDFGNQNEPITSIIGSRPGIISEGNEFVFDGVSRFIEIPYHKVYQPLWIEGDLIIDLEFLPENVKSGELIMSACLCEPATGWRLRLENDQLILSLYGSNQVMHQEFDLPIIVNEWNTLQCRISSHNEFGITLNSQTADGKAPFPREYSQDGHYIGSEYGVANFFKGRIRNLRMSEGC